MIVFYHLPKEQQKWVQHKYPQLRIKFVHSTPIAVPPPKATTVLSIHSNCSITKELLQQLPNVQLIVTRTTGTDHIDLKACKDRGVLVANAAGMNARSVAEFTFGLLLNVTRNIGTGHKRVLGGEFSDEGMSGMELQGKTLGVVGTGAIGATVLEFAHAFGMQLLAYDFKKNVERQKQIGYTYVSLKRLFAKSDIVSLHVPGTPQTHHMVNRSVLWSMKKGSGIINTARGSVVNTQSILAALQSGQLGWYAADVLEDEHTISKVNRALIRHPRTLITPHMAHSTVEAAERVLVQSMDHIEKFLAGKQFPTVQ